MVARGYGIDPSGPKTLYVLLAFEHRGHRGAAEYLRTPAQGFSYACGHFSFVSSFSYLCSVLPSQCKRLKQEA
jgi:hypothetical protein